MRYARAGRESHGCSRFANDINFSFSPTTGPATREIGRFRRARLHEWDDLDTFFVRYRRKLMAILRHPLHVKNHTNIADTYRAIFTAR